MSHLWARTNNLFDEKSIERGTVAEQATAVGATYEQLKKDTPGTTRLRSIYLIKTNGEFSLTINSNFNVFLCFFDSNQLYTKEYTSWVTSYQGTSPYIAVVIKRSDGSMPELDDDFQLMINTGTTALPYEPYRIEKPLDHVYVKARTENLFDKNNIVSGGDWYITTKVVASVNCDMFVLPCKPNTIYTVSRQVILHRFTVGFVDSFPLYKDQVVSGAVFDSDAYSITTTSAADSAYIVVYYAKHAGTDSNTAEEIQQCIDTMMVVEGSIAPSQYVPYRITKEAWEAKTRVILHGLTNPLCGISTYKDTLDLSSGGLTRKIKKLVLTGQETVTYQLGSSAPFKLILTQPMTLPETSDIFWCCSHFVSISNAEWAQHGGQYSEFLSWHTSDGGSGLRFKDTVFSTADAFKTYLADQYAAGTPVTVWYVLATPTTETITVPSNLTGTVEGFLTQTGTPSPTNPIYPTANGTPEQGGTYSLDTGAYAIAWGRADTFTGTSSISVRGYGLPVKSWSIDGNAVQSGTPAQDAPVSVDGCGDEINGWSGGWRQNSPVFTVTENSDGTFSVESTLSTGTNYLAFNLTDEIPTYKTTYFQVKVSNGSAGLYSNGKFRICFRRVSGNQIVPGTSVTITSDGVWRTSYNGSEEVYASVIFCDANIVFVCTIGDVVLTDGYKISLTSAGQTQNVYLGRVQTTRRIKKLVLYGTESWSELGTSGKSFYIVASDILVGGEAISTHYESKPFNVIYDGLFVGVGVASTQKWLAFSTGTVQTTDAWKTYLASQYAAGTPVTVWYVLANEQTGIVNEPLMKIGSYVDTLTSEQAGVTLPTNDGTTTISVGTTIAPSSMTVKVHAKPVHFGFKIDKSVSDPSNAVIYTHDAVTMTPAGMDFANGVFDYGSWENVWFIKNARPVMLNFDGTEAYDIDPNDYSKKLDGTASDIADSTKSMNAMIAFPTVWIKRTDDGSYNYIEISDRQLDSDFHAYAHEDANGVVKPYIYLPIYKGSMVDGKLRSISGVKPQSGTTAQQEVDAASALGTGWQIWDYTSKEMLCDLLTLISKSLDTQGKFGQGHSTGGNSASDFLNCGTLNDKGKFFGYSTTTSQVKCFGMEALWAERWDIELGLILDAGIYKIKEHPAYNLTGEGYTAISTSVAQSPTSNNYIKTEVSTQFGSLPTVVGGTQSTYYCDYFYQNQSGVRVAIRGGYCDNDAYSGLRYVNVYTAASLSAWHIGASPVYK